MVILDSMPSSVVYVRFGLRRDCDGECAVGVRAGAAGSPLHPSPLSQIPGCGVPGYGRPCVASGHACVRLFPYSLLLMLCRNGWRHACIRLGSGTPALERPRPVRIGGSPDRATLSGSDLCPDHLSPCLDRNLRSRSAQTDEDQRWSRAFWTLSGPAQPVQSGVRAVWTRTLSRPA